MVAQVLPMGAAMADDGRSEESKLPADRAGLWRDAAERAIAYRDGLVERCVALLGPVSSFAQSH